MSIIGLGIDIVKIKRIKNIISNFKGFKFAKHILNIYELKNFFINKKKINFLAKHFAIKEAAAKAFNTGIRDGLYFKHIEFYHDFLGKPKIRFYYRAAELIKKNKIKNINVSLSDEKNYVCAVVIFETNN